MKHTRSKPLHLFDNNYNKEYLIQEGDNIADIERIASMKLTDQNELASLLVFPHSFRDTELYSSHRKSEDIPAIIELERDFAGHPTKIRTGNVMGFIGYGETEIRIHSRFDKTNDDSEKDANDYFLYHMLATVFHVNLFKLDTTSSKKNNILDLLMVMFPQMLKDAMSQGLYKEYRTYKYNDARVKGTIEVNRFIRENIPFQGRVAYRTREFSHDNKILQLVRHTIEYMRSHPWGKGLLNNDLDTRSNVLQIINATPSYIKRERLRVLSDNRHPMSHPYYTKYRALQQLCLSILRHEGLLYGEEKDKVHGILFDGAWLWEEYVACLLKDHFQHYTDRNSHFNLFSPVDDNGFQKIIPDYLSHEVDAEGKYAAVADAKYMYLRGNNLSADRAAAVYYKTIMYMYRFGADTGFLFHPIPSDSTDIEPKKELLIEGPRKGKLIVVGLRILKQTTDMTFAQFQTTMKTAEKQLIQHIPAF